MKAPPDAKTLIGHLARQPRPAGSEPEARAREFCAEFLRAEGFTVREEPFTYSELPGRWWLPVTGFVVLVAGAILVAGVWLDQPRRSLVPALLVLLAAAVLVRLLGRAVGARWLRMTTANLVAIRGDSEPRVWLCAHLDTKSQPIPTLVRSAGVMLAIAGALATTVLLVLSLAGSEVAAPVLVLVAGALGLGGLILLLSTVGADAPGAADNASGVAAVLLAAQATRGVPLGIVLTSAEELRLAGAEAWVSARQSGGGGEGARPAATINCDTLDDSGSLRCVYHSRRDASLAEDVSRAASYAGVELRRTRWAPGVLLDSHAMAARGLAAVTLSRVTLGTLARIHTRRDTAEGLDGGGAVRAARVMAAFVQRDWERVRGHA